MGLSYEESLQEHIETWREAHPDWDEREFCLALQDIATARLLDYHLGSK